MHGVQGTARLTRSKKWSLNTLTAKSSTGSKASSRSRSSATSDAASVLVHTSTTSSSTSSRIWSNFESSTNPDACRGIFAFLGPVRIR